LPAHDNMVYPGVAHHQRVLRAIVDHYAADPRVRAVALFGSLARGDWHDASDLDLDIVLADGVAVNSIAELMRLCDALTAIGVAPVPLVILSGMLVFGLSVTTLGLAWVTALQQYIPVEQMGRVSSIDELGSYVGIPLSHGVAGVLTDHFGPTVILTWGGALAAGVIALGLISRSVRTLD